MAKKFPPPLPQLKVQQTVGKMKVNRLKCFQELIRRMKEPGLIFTREDIQILKTYLPDATQLCVLHEWLGHIP